MKEFIKLLEFFLSNDLSLSNIQISSCYLNLYLIDYFDFLILIYSIMFNKLNRLYFKNYIDIFRQDINEKIFRFLIRYVN